MLTSISRYFYTILEPLLGRHFTKDGFTKHFRNVQWVAISRILIMVLSLITTMIIARLLGPVSFGALNYTLSIVGLFGILASLGIDNVVYREITKHKEDRLEILGSALFLKLITGLTAFLSVLVLLFFIDETLYIKKIVLVLSLSFLTQPLILLSYDFLKDSEAKYVTITQIVTMLLSNISKIAVVYFFHSLVGFVFILVLENIISGFLYITQIKLIKKRVISFKVSKKYLAYIFSFSVPLVLFSAFSELYSRIDQIMLRHYLDVEAVGLYAAAVRLTEIWYMVPNILMGALFPAFIHSHDNSLEYNKRLKIFIITLTILSLGISCVTLFLSKILTSFVYGKDFIAASPVLSIYIFSLFGSFLSFIIYQDLFIKNKLFLIIFIPLFTALLNIFLNIFLIPSYGLVGAALATVTSYNVIPFLYLLTRKKSKLL
jgi:O-antigen/teichoic acid export membrane protein